MGSFWSDFKDFVNQDNLVGLALAVVLGGAFGAIASLALSSQPSRL
ncbi:MscL family protein [Nodosilinea sp. P-1105]|nr:MscL family protein [Nodosilinea sp. P-1105]NMF84405.1 hypothetical protein [Nodosilinea sp. P-1105]